MKMRLISFELLAEFGFFKKPDINDGLYLTYNIIHKPALLGILGAIAGLQGYQNVGELPDYYKEFNKIKIGIKPLLSDNGNYTKEMLSYNNSTGFANGEGNLIVTEQILINPSYKCFLLLDLSNQNEKTLYENILSYEAMFLPYMGKNDFSAWWTNAYIHDSYEKFDFSCDYKISTIFTKTEAVSNYVAKSMSSFSDETKELPFLYFEKLPIKFDENLFQYSYADFVYSNAKFNRVMNMKSSGEFYQINDNEIIQLF
jgi:CRISPR-associated protein Cas5h